MKTHSEQGGHKPHRKRLGPGLPLEKMAHRAESKWDKRVLKSAPDWRTAAARARLKKLKAKLGLPPKQASGRGVWKPRCLSCYGLPAFSLSLCSSPLMQSLSSCSDTAADTQ